MKPLKIIGIDFGDVRTGIAVCDPSMLIASPVGTITGNMQQTLTQTAEIIKQHGASRAVVGMPRNMNGTYGPRADICKNFSEKLHEITGIEVILWDERLTTVSAHKILSESNVRGKKRKQTVDTLSAVLILQNYLDAIR